jgi:hypothetical protein
MGTKDLNVGCEHNRQSERHPGTPSGLGCRHAKPVLESQQEFTQEKFMAISQDLLEMLVCPICKVSVKLLGDQSGLKCPQCKRVYPVRDDIPVMLPEEASIAGE